MLVQRLEEIVCRWRVDHMPSLHEAAGVVTEASPPWYLPPGRVHVHPGFGCDVDSERIRAPGVTSVSESVARTVRCFVSAETTADFAGESMRFAAGADCAEPIPLPRMTAS